MTFNGTSNRALPLGVLTLAVALTSCGGGSSPAAKSEVSAAASSQATAGNSSDTGAKGAARLCDLITQDEAQAALKEPLTAGVSRSGQTPAGLSGSCKYLGPTVNATTHGKGLVQVVILGTKLTRAQFDELSTSEGKIGAEAEAKQVPGLGETAFYVGNSYGGILTVFDHGLDLTVQVARSDRTTVDEAAVIKMAKTALSRAGDLR